MRTENLSREYKNIMGRLRGFGGCGRCADTWDWKPSHTTEVTEGYGCFPLCEECWSSLTIEERLPFYERMVQRWVEPGEPFKWPAIEAAVREGK